MGTSNQLRPLTVEELEALRTYASMHGRTWKSKLSSWWQSSPVVSSEPARLVYCLRNTHGPSWLDKFKLPEPEQVSQLKLLQENKKLRDCYTALSALVSSLRYDGGENKHWFLPSERSGDVEHARTALATVERLS